MQARPIQLAVMVGVGMAVGMFSWGQNAALEKALKEEPTRSEASSRPSSVTTAAKRTPQPSPPASAVSRSDPSPATPKPSATPKPPAALERVTTRKPLSPSEQPAYVKQIVEIALQHAAKHAKPAAPENSPLTAEEARELREAVAQLSSKDDWQRKNGIWRLEALKEKAAPAIPNLIAQLGSKGGENDRKERGVIRFSFTLPGRIVDRSPGWQAGAALVAIGPAAVPALTHALQTATPYAQQNAVEALSELRGARALPLFRAMLQGQFSLSRTAALEPDRMELRRTLIRSLTGMKDQEAIPLLVACLRLDHDRSIRVEAAESLAKLDAQIAVPALKVATRDLDQMVRRAAYTALSKLAGPSVLASELSTREDTEGVLEFCGVADKSSLPALIALLRHRESMVRLSAAGALGRLRDPGTIPVLLERLADADDEDRIALCQVLEGFRDARTTPYLLVLLKAPNAKVRRAAAFALGWPQNPGAWEPLARLALRDPDSQVRRAAVCAVGCLHTRDEHSAALFNALLADPDPKVRQEAKLRLSLLPQQAHARLP